MEQKILLEKILWPSFFPYGLHHSGFEHSVAICIMIPAGILGKTN
jgi:hypothetical protein